MHLKLRERDAEAVLGAGRHQEFVHGAVEVVVARRGVAVEVDQDRVVDRTRSGGLEFDADVAQMFGLCGLLYAGLQRRVRSSDLSSFTRSGLGCLSAWASDSRSR